MIVKLLLLSTALFTFTCSIGGVRQVHRDLTDNAITEEGGITYLNFELGLIPSGDRFNNTEAYGKIHIKISDDYSFNYKITLFDEFNDLFETPTESFSISRWNVNGLSNVKLQLHFYRSTDLYQPNNYVDTIDWVEFDDFGNGYDSGTNLLKKQYQSDNFYENNIDNEYYFVLPIDLINSFFLDGWNSSYTRGYNEGLSDGYSNGYQVGSEQGYSNGYYEGYRVGNLDGSNTTINFLGLFGAIADTPVLIIRNLFGFDIFGTSALTIFMSLLTACVVIHFIRKFI